MGEFFKKVMAQFTAIYGKLGTTQKIVIGAAAGVIAVVFVVVVSASSSAELNYLFQRPLSPEDYARITKKLQEYGADFKTKDDRYVLVKDEASGAALRMRLGQDNILPQDIKGWELFDTEKWTTTDFERNIMKRRAIIGAMTRHLNTSAICRMCGRFSRLAFTFIRKSHRSTNLPLLRFSTAITSTSLASCFSTCSCPHSSASTTMVKREISGSFVCDTLRLAML
jgi:hypothetical protein